MFLRSPRPLGRFARPAYCRRRSVPILALTVFTRSIGTSSIRWSNISNRDSGSRTPGLLVTEELEKVVEECKASVAKISAECRAQNRKYRDPDFDLINDRHNCLHGLNPPEHLYCPQETVRITQLCNKPSFFGAQGPHVQDIHQGGVGDCWFLAALSGLTTKQGLIEQLCVARDELVGVYGFIFFRETKWVSVIIDDLIFASTAEWVALSSNEKSLYHNNQDRYDSFVRKSMRGLYFAKGGAEDRLQQTWVPLIEKAYAKLHGDYQSLDKGFAGEACEDLTGGVSTIFHIRDILDADKFWKDELLKAGHDRFFTCSLGFARSERNNNAVANDNGLIGYHEYAVIKAVEVAGTRFVVMRNPSSSYTPSEWTGKWSDGDSAWTPEWLARLPEIGHSFGRSDGQFVMEYSDFISTRNWDNIDRTLIFDPSWTMSLKGLKLEAPTLPLLHTWGQVAFKFSIPESTPAVIDLSRLSDRYFSGFSGRSKWQLSMAVFKAGASEPLFEPVGFAYKTLSQNYTMELDLDPGDYVVHVKATRKYTGNQDWMEEGLKKWDWEKASRVSSARVDLEAQIEGVPSEEEVKFLPFPLKAIRGRSLSELVSDARAAVQSNDTETTEVLQSKDVPENLEENQSPGNVEGEKPKADDPNAEDNILFLILKLYTKRASGDLSIAIEGQSRGDVGWRDLGLKEKWWIAT
ncbi:hypothetical protein DL96DRAFT_1505563 [Flagelloscypha sp. PMI_526]|nr:hypothetical protein DL96DRAFT_1505563 [Flagelloscypha sp. PMI_526]